MARCAAPYMGAILQRPAAQAWPQSLLLCPEDGRLNKQAAIWLALKVVDALHRAVVLALWHLQLHAHPLPLRKQRGAIVAYCAAKAPPVAHNHLVAQLEGRALRGGGFVRVAHRALRRGVRVHAAAHVALRGGRGQQVAQLREAASAVQPAGERDDALQALAPSGCEAAAAGDAGAETRRLLRKDAVAVCGALPGGRGGPGVPGAPALRLRRVIAPRGARWGDSSRRRAPPRLPRRRVCGARGLRRSASRGLRGRLPRRAAWAGGGGAAGRAPRHRVGRHGARGRRLLGQRLLHWRVHVQVAHVDLPRQLLCHRFDMGARPLAVLRRPAVLVALTLLLLLLLQALFHCRHRRLLCRPRHLRQRHSRLDLHRRLERRQQGAVQRGAPQQLVRRRPLAGLLP
mmetsp:Transcript_23092/g.58247  ORF Transcript_23092/g.58247 Transcript_23092/m.58247 type:complete len:400 (+) Transcript_23092:210-1409(+)